ncbi:disulfide bond formation protein B [uncultured Aquitalea sp.]|uniref:disulfide bond formation protein B n=1 Tax=uncultured Aquitalea sp. TaxID=540272 RepID=UPI0025DB245D|nr:disulfide bond formation protein B [uncultured Aquitalea sp.]
MFFLIAAACAGAMGFALYAQHVLGLEPCPLCIFQRVGVISVGVIALLAGLVNPGRAGTRVWGVLGLLAGLGGISVSLRQLWLQSLPAEQVPACGPGLDYLMETSPFWDVLSKVFKGSGECAAVDWTFLGQAMPFWVAVFFLGVMAMLVWQVVRKD